MLSNITIGQYFPGDSFLHRMDPRAKIVATMIFIIAIFLAETTLAYTLVGLFTLFTVRYRAYRCASFGTPLNRCGLSSYLPWVFMFSQHRAR